MHRISRQAVTFAAALAAAVGIVGAQNPPAGGGQAPQPPGAARGGTQVPPMKFSSAAFTDGGRIPDKFGCSAQPANVSPALQWTDVPSGAVSLALIMHDLDPRPQRGFDDFLHWMLWNIPPPTTQLPEGVPATAQLADGAMQYIAQGRGGGPGVGYRSPCPPAGTPHHYVFELFALDTKLDLPAAATRADVQKGIDGHILGHAVIVGLFSR